MLSAAVLASVVVFASSVDDVPQAPAETGSCEFTNEPAGVGYFWDTTCHMGGLGCDADGKNVECRLCGAGDFVSVPCPPSSCHFGETPSVSYYWDVNCKDGKLGCLADGAHLQCRFCGEAPYESVPCPEHASHQIPRNVNETCTFDTDPEFPYYVDPDCEDGVLGCGAGGSAKCRFCGKREFAEVPCDAAKVCQVDASLPHYWESECKDGMLGCNADGRHLECRYCDQAPFEEVPCPTKVEAKTKFLAPGDARR